MADHRCLHYGLSVESLAPAHEREAIFQLGFIASQRQRHCTLPPDFAYRQPMTIFTSMFLHSGWMHIGGNMLYLWIFGDNVEESMGRIKFILFYALCGMAAALAQLENRPGIPDTDDWGVRWYCRDSGAYLMLYPKAAIRTFVLIIVFVRSINLPAWIVLGILIGTVRRLPNALASDGGGVAYLAHIGGFAAGMILIPFSNGVMYHSLAVMTLRHSVGLDSRKLFQSRPKHINAIVPAKRGTHWVHAGSRPDLQRMVTAQVPKSRRAQPTWISAKLETTSS